jgi:pilus assembly protein CpaC
LSQKNVVQRRWMVGRLAALMLALAAIAAAPRPAAAQATDIIAVSLGVGRSYPITLPVPVTKVVVANPEVADAVVLGEREVVLIGKATGETDVILLLNNGTRRHYRVDIRSPGERPQIALSLKFAEIRKDALHTLGVSALYRDRNVRAGTGIFRSDNPIDPNTGAVSIPNEGSFLTVLTDFGTDKLLAFIEAESQKGNARILAEPRLMAGNREEATFLAGGELPIPIAQAGADVGAGVRVTVQWREFGVRLRFLGEVISEDLVKLALTPEVSSLDYNNAITVSGFRIPALRTRRTQTTLDMRPNSSLIVSGLFSNEREMVRTGIPGLMDIPLIGVLFGSTRWQNNETELVVIVTPTVLDSRNPRPSDVAPVRPDTALPAREVLEPRLRPGTPPRRP